MDIYYAERTRRTRRRPEGGNTHRTTQKDTKKDIKLENARPWWNTWILVQEIHLHSRQISTRNEQMLTSCTNTWLDDQRKDHIDLKGPKQRKCSKQLQIHNLSTDDVENINSTNKRRNLLLANKPQIIPWGTERMPQRIQNHISITLHKLTHSRWEEDQTENLAMAWIDYKKAYDMVPQSWIINCPKTYNISHEVINFIEKTMKTWRVELTAGGRSLAEQRSKEVFFKEMHYHPYCS